MAFWAENADFVDINGRFHEGRDLISALFRRGLANNPGRMLTMTSASRKLLAPNVALDDGILELASADGEKDRGRYSVVWTKANGQWLIRSARDIPLPEEEVAKAPDTPPLEELQWLVGKWEARSDRHHVALDCSWQLNKSFLVQRYLVKSTDEEDFEVVNWIAYDPSANSFHSWYFDSRGGFGGGPWTRRDNVWRTSVAAVLPDGQTGSSIMTWEQIDANTARWRAIDREVEGASIPDSEKTYVRVPATGAGAATPTRR
jgi:ketosteroid isomerase-like protein